MDVWKFIHDKLSANIDVLLLFVLESEGSSPGRKGFKMAVAADGDMNGTIGGGIMEYKLVEKAKTLLQENERKISVIRQYHDKSHDKNQSGMICSGSQLNALIPLNTVNVKKTIEKIVKSQQLNENKTLHLSPFGIELINEAASGFKYKTERDWGYSEPLIEKPIIHIIGGGHVGLALSELMHFLGFYIKLYDDRNELNTVEQNSFADEKHSVNYNSIDGSIHFNENDFVVIMTVGYRTDKIVLRKLLSKNVFYLGLLGSEKKVKTLFAELKEEGADAGRLNRVYTPIGINIYSKTAKEIAVSIAAQIILEKNKNLPTGRTN
jgi:xanthine dehydrogenase accessory factor